MSQALDLLNVLNDGGIVKNMMGEEYDFSQFKGRLNTKLAAAVGHSFGGATTLTALSNDARFLSVIYLCYLVYGLCEGVGCCWMCGCFQYTRNC